MYSDFFLEIELILCKTKKIPHEMFVFAHLDYLGCF